MIPGTEHKGILNGFLEGVLLQLGMDVLHGHGLRLFFLNVALSRLVEVVEQKVFAPPLCFPHHRTLLIHLS